MQARTTAIPAEAAADLIALLPDDAPGVSWVHRGEGLVGWGVAASVETAGPTRFSDANKWWDEVIANAQVTDEVGLPGTGLVSFGSFAFADSPGNSVLMVPSVVVGRRGSTAWVTVVEAGAGASELDTGRSAPIPRGEATCADPAPLPSAPTTVFGPGSLTDPAWMEAVAEAVRRINAGELEKVVLARDLVATSAEEIDIRRPLARLAAGYPNCWTFHVDDMFGATPEMLVRKERGLVASRVLAGTIRRTGNDEHDLALAATLARSSKDLEEHEFAVRSVADALEPHCASMNVPESPFVLHLPNVMHLATDITGVARDDVSSLELAASLHPSAAVGGTPTAKAVEMIAELERMDRGRYAGPVGWMDASGDGEWGIALRSAQMVDARTVRMFAGAGVVGASVPADELAETDAKFLPVRGALAD